MMRSLWIAFSTVAVANLLALAGFVGWLSMSGRLNAERVERVRAVLAKTIAQERAEAEASVAQARAAEAAAAEAARVGTPPLTAEQRLERSSAASEVEAQRERRVQRETADLINTLMRERADLDRERAEFQARIEAFEAMRRAVAEEAGSEQFQRTVQLYQSVRPDGAKRMMASLIAAGRTDQVVAYLNALPTRVASKIVAEFEKEDAKLAADLLERLRRRGTGIAGSNGSAEGKPLAAANPEK